MAANLAPDGLEDAAVRQRVALSTLSNYASKLIALGVGFLLTPFVLRQLGPEAYGLWVLVGSVAAYGTLLDFGMTGAVVKYVAEFHARGEMAQAGRLIAAALWLYLGFGLLGLALSALLALAFPMVFNVPADQRLTAQWLLLLAGLNIGVSLPTATTTAVLRGLQRFDLSNLINVGGTLLHAAATVTVLLLGGGLLGMMAVSLPVTLLMQVPAIWLVRRQAPGLRYGLRGADRRLVRTVLGFSSPLFLGQVASQLHSKSDEIVIGLQLPLALVTPYAIARRLSELPQILADQFAKVVLPLAAQLHAVDDQRRLRALYLTSTRLTLAIFVPLACVLVVLARTWLTLWVGPAYAGYGYLILILTLASLFDTMQWPATAILQAMARHRWLAVLALATASVNLGLSLVLIGRFGLAGVALGTLIPAAIESLCFVLPYVMRINRVGLRTMLTDIYLPVLLPAVPLVALLLALSWALPSARLWLLVPSVAGGLVLYGGLYLRFSVCAAERHWLAQAAQRLLAQVRRRLLPT